MLPYVRQSTVIEIVIVILIIIIMSAVFFSSGRLLSLSTHALSRNVNSTHDSNGESLFVPQRVVSHSFHSLKSRHTVPY